jgi:hypothetical protein
LLDAGVLLGLLFNPEDGGGIFPLKCNLTCNGLCGLVFQKKTLFMTTAVVKFYNTEKSREQGTELNLKEWKKQEAEEGFIMRGFIHISLV